jgi:hypothetical protein
MAAGETTSGPAVAAAGAAANDGGASQAAASPDDIMDPGARMAAMLAEGVDVDNTGAAPPTASFAGDAAREEAAKPKGDVAPGDDQADATSAPTQTDAVLRAGFRKLEGEKRKLIELQAQATGAVEKAKSADEFFAALESDPAAALLARGGEALVDKVIDAIADLSKPSAERDLAKLKRELKAKDDAIAAERAQADQQAQIARWRKGIHDEVAAGGEKFDVVNSLGDLGRDAVVDMITQHYAATKQTMSNAQAAAKLETFLRSKLDGSTTYGSRGTQAAAPAAKPQPAQGSAPRPAPKQTGVTTLSAVHPAEVTVTDEDLQEMHPEKRLAAVYAELGIH